MGCIVATQANDCGDETTGLCHEATGTCMGCDNEKQSQAVSRAACVNHLCVDCDDNEDCMGYEENTTLRGTGRCSPNHGCTLCDTAEECKALASELDWKCSAVAM